MHFCTKLRIIKRLRACDRLFANESEYTPYATVVCQVGDQVYARYNGGKKYPATIAVVESDSITVDWTNDYPEHRRVPKDHVYKNGLQCEAVVDGGVESVGRRPCKCPCHYLNDS